MSTQQKPTAIANELHALLSRYADIVSAQHNALRGGMVRTAAVLARNAESVLAAAHHTDRLLTSAQALNPIELVEWDDIQRRLRTAFSQAQAGSNQLGKTLADTRTSMLREIVNLEPNGSNLGSTAPPPALLNIRT